MSPFMDHASTSIGPEMIQTNALVQIMENLPQQLQRQAQAWTAVDREIADKLVQQYIPLEIEIPRPTSYYGGVRLGILGMPWDSFPAVAVACTGGGPAVDSARIDGWGMSVSTTLVIEAIVRSDKFVSGDPNPTSERVAERVRQEGILDRRAKRTMEALVQCIAIDRTLGALVPQLSDPTFTHSDPFSLPGVASAEDASYQRVFSLVRIQYTPGVIANWPDTQVPSPTVLPGGFG